MTQITFDSVKVIMAMYFRWVGAIFLTFSRSEAAKLVIMMPWQSVYNVSGFC